jgi:hypothetical protein
MERINSHVMGRHKERIAEHTARLSASLAASHSRSFAPLPNSASRSLSAQGGADDASSTEAATDNDGGAPLNVPPMGGDVEAHIQAMHEQIRRHTEEHRARIHAEMQRVHHEIRQMSGSFRGDENPHIPSSASASASNAIEERSLVDDTPAL